MTTIAKNIVTGEFEKVYTDLRKKEGRMYTDEEVARLPVIARSHMHFKEWQMRKQSCDRLVKYLEKKNEAGRPFKLLEAGCGNGWLSHQLAVIPGITVIGSDINFVELQQAGRVFSEILNLHFIYGNIEADLFGEKQFDAVIFAASIQYFPDLASTINKALRLLKPGGEIHVLDSPFYAVRERRAAKQRSVIYYESIGFPEMAEAYFHHCIEELAGFDHKFLYDPDSLYHKLLPNKNIFPWIRIRL